MLSYKHLPPALLLLLLLAVGCDSVEPESFSEEYVVEAYLVAGASLPPVELTKTVELDRTYDFDAAAVADADVSIYLLDEGGAVEAEYPYRPDRKGVYVPVDTGPIVEPLRRYALEVGLPGEAQAIRAETLVPGFLDILDTTGDTLDYQSGDQFELHVVPSPYSGRQGIYVAKLFAIDTTYGMSPFYADIVEEDDDELAEDFVENRSGLVNEAFFINHADGSLTLRLPWISVAFYGPNDVIINAIDDNLYDLERSLASGDNRSPGEADNLIEHIDGGIGIFGSFAPDTLRVFVRPPAP